MKNMFPWRVVENYSWPEIVDAAGDVVAVIYYGDSTSDAYYEALHTAHQIVDAIHLKYEIEKEKKC